MPIVGDILYVLVGIDVLMLFTGQPSVIGWILDKLGI